MIFWILAGLLMILAVVALAPALLRDRYMRELDRRQQNIDIARERLDEIAAEHASGEMTREVYEQVKEELEASLIDDVEVTEEQAGDEPPARVSMVGKWTWVFFIVLVPLASLALYLQIGSPQYVQYAGAGAGREASVQSVAASAKSLGELIDILKTRLEKQPEDAESWYLLARAYMEQSDYQQALTALQKTHALLGDNVQVLLGMADAMAMTRDGDLQGEPTEYLEKVLQMEPENTTGLWLGGMAAQQNGEFQKAVDRWSRLLPQLQGDPQNLAQLEQLIAQAVDAAGQAGVTVQVPQPPQQEPAASVTVNLSADVPAALDPSTTVYVFARAANGPPMPLAVARLTLADLPQTVTLDDDGAMMPQLKMSAFENVVVSARASLSGNPVTEAGDYSSARLQLPVQARAEIDLVIDTLIDNPDNLPAITVADMASAPAQQSATEETDTAQAQTADSANDTGEVKAIHAWVSLAPEMQSQVAPGDTLFVFARATAGPPMPLAVKRLTAAELPLEVTLDDSMAMMPQMKLSDFDQVSVSARISRSGEAMAASGDITSQTVDVRLDGNVGVNLTLDRLVE